MGLESAALLRVIRVSLLNPSMRLTFSGLVCLLALSVASPVHAQVLGNPTDVISSGTSYHVFAQPGEPTLEVLVLGDAATGIYVVGTNTTLIELLALTGSGSSSGQSADVRREVTIRLMREQGGSRRVVYEQEFSSFLAEPGSYPALQDGDLFTVEVKQHRRTGLREVLEITSRLSSITLLVLRLVDVL